MPSYIKLLQGLVGQAPPKINRRDFLKKTGALAAAATPLAAKLPEVLPEVAQQAAGVRPDLLPPGLMDGFGLPDGSIITRLGDDIAFEPGPLAMENASLADLRKWTDAIERARRAMGDEAAPGVVSHFNHLTNTWHAPVLERVGEDGDDLYRTHYLRAGQSAPDNLADGWSPADPHTQRYFDENLAFGEGIDENTVRNLTDEWKRWKSYDLQASLDKHPKSQEYHKKQMAENPKYRQSHIDALRAFELAPGGRADQQPVMDIDPDPYRRGTIDKKWGRMPAVPFERVGKGTFLSAPLGAALLSPQEER